MQWWEDGQLWASHTFWCSDLQASGGTWWNLQQHPCNNSSTCSSAVIYYTLCHHHNSFTWCWKDPLTLPSYQDEVHPATRAWIPKVGTINLHKAYQVDLADLWHLVPDLRYIARLAWDITNTPSWDISERLGSEPSLSHQEFHRRSPTDIAMVASWRS